MTPLPRTLLASLCLILAGISSQAWSADPAPVLNLGLKYAQRDAQRAAEASQAAATRLAAEVAKLQAAEKLIVDSQAAKVAADKAVIDTAAAIVAAETARVAADKTVLDAVANAQKVKDDAAADQAAKDLAQQTATTAQTAATAAAELVKAKQAAKVVADTNKPVADKQLEVAQATLKPAQEAKAAVEKDTVAIAAIAKATQDKAAFYATALPVAKVEPPRLIQTLTHTRPFQSCRIDPTGDFVFGGCQDNSIQRWDLVLGTKVPMVGHKSWIADFDFQPGSNMLISAAYEGRVHWWNDALTVPTSIRNVAAHKGQVRALSFSRDGQYIATAGNDKMVRIWRAADGALLKELEGHTRHVYNVAFHPNGKHLISGDLMGILKQWEVESWQLVRDYDAKLLTGYDPTFKADCGGIRGIDFSPDGRFLAVGGIGEVSNAFAGIGKPMVLIFDWVTGQRIHVLSPKGAFQGTVWGLQFHPSGSFLLGVGGGGSGGMWFWDVETGTALLDVALPQVAFDLSIHPDGLRIAVASYDNSIKIFDLGPKTPDAAPAK
ncbi:MAG: hypothetical protein JWN70_5786 [Planctomycetaceae bacterium]|nr:hypothetical protein [Planctomycetaceae bacterium]